MVGWVVELSEFGLRYEPRGSVKGQHLADFAVELSQHIPTEQWSLYVDGAAGQVTAGVGIVLEGPEGFLLEQSLVFKFKASNNQAEYEALIVGLQLTKDMGASSVTCHTDSQLVTGQMIGEYQVKDEQLLRYFHKANALTKEFQQCTLKHIPWQENTRADLLYKLRDDKEKGRLTTVICQVLAEPSVECLAINDMEVPDWQTEIRKLMKKQDDGQPLKSADARWVARYIFIGEDLYQRGFSTPLLKCIGPNETSYVMNELHNGVCGFHTGKRTLKARALRAGYF